MRILKGQIFPKIFKDVHSIPRLSLDQIDSFHRNGYLAIEQFLNLAIVDKLIARYEPLFAGDFTTKNYPDEWYGRTGMSLPNVTKEICNGWKSDHMIANIVLSSQIHHIASQLYGWNSSRIAQDDIISKPFGGGTAVQFHRDGDYISQQFLPSENNSVTIWLPLDDVSLQSGTIEYVPTSHNWKISSENLSFHTSSSSSSSPSSSSSSSPSSSSTSATDPLSTSNHSISHRLNFQSSLPSHYQQPTYHFIEIPRGGVVFHHQNIFHGSGINQSSQQMRRALVIHTLRGDAEFNLTQKPSYIYGRYQLKEVSKDDSQTVHFLPTLHESFFPICWSDGTKKNIQRSKWLESYCSDLSIEEIFQP